LHKQVEDLIILEGVFSPPICGKGGRTEAQGKLIYDGRNDNFPTAGIISPD
jgi:hypothetical protein